ncbi:WD repeat-containing protein 44-like isoform X2 [Phalaenopsis equestris]|uniref:WD repeat-containing protein 44-like isoform X2 n=2 Tax=Phalaenopsis equestris TaxID=78828 RepID=UPI0009E59235|nr:WD repeat-containing protein 44-like isoform X2 [Phalaenopsis equestris]
MSNSVEGEEDDEFYESLNRDLSSSCSSTSSSDDEGDYGCPKQHRHHAFFSLPSPISFDVWLSQPGSVEERRRHFLQQIGLACDPELSLVNPNGGRSGVGREGEMGRSTSCDGLCPLVDPARAKSIVGTFARSRSDGSVKPRSLRRQLASVTDKPPLIGRSRPSVGGELEVLDGEGEEAQRCTIKDLGNGNEFVIKEFREDGMWNKLREVETGRQFSMEEFELSVGSSPIVKELMRRQNVVGRRIDSSASGHRSKDSADSNGGGRSKKRSSWLKSLKNAVAVGKQRNWQSSDVMDTSSEKGGRRSSSATDDIQDKLQSPCHGPERIKVRQYGKSHKELTGLFLSQEIQAHNGSIWTIKFSLNGRYLASAGEDCVIHAWQVFEHDRKLEFLVDRAGQDYGSVNLAANPNKGLPEEMFLPSCMERIDGEGKRTAKGPSGSKSLSSDHVMMPEQAFALSEKPVCSFIGHLDDVLDLSWSKSQNLLSSSMDMTVRLWHLSSNSCLKIFTHNDYVTCIQFNPVDDRYFISGSLDAKVRLWNIPDRQVVDWSDQHEIITAVCYKPDGQGALVGSNVGNCHLYDTADNKLLQKSTIDLHNKAKKSSHKKITGFQFVRGSSSEVLITSADSRIRLVDGSNLVHKFKESGMADEGVWVGGRLGGFAVVGKLEINQSISVGKLLSTMRYHLSEASITVEFVGLHL